MSGPPPTMPPPTPGSAHDLIVTLNQLLIWAVFTVWGAQVIAMIRYAGVLARRIPDNEMVRQSRIEFWRVPVLFIGGLAVTRLAPPHSVVAILGTGQLIAVWLYCSLLSRLRTHIGTILLDNAVIDRPKARSDAETCV